MTLRLLAVFLVAVICRADGHPVHQQVVAQHLLTDAVVMEATEDQTEQKALALWRYFWDRYKADKLERDAPRFGCTACRFLVRSFHYLMEKPRTVEMIVKYAIEICRVFRIEDENVCNSVIPEFKNEVLYLVNNLVLNPNELCGLVIGDECGKPYDPTTMWNVTLPSTQKPPVVPPTPPRPGAPSIRILQISDIHYDELYEIGSNAVCDEPLCCHKQDGMAPAGKPAAGKWGFSGPCDAPIQLIENMMHHINQTDKFDAIYWTGDLPSHRVWNQTRTDQIQLYELLTRLFKKYFPNTPIYSALGNHESAPVNSFPPPFIQGSNSIKWLYDELQTSWLNWLPDSTKQTIDYGAYYTTLIRPGLRIVSLNMNYCNNMNWWLLLNTTDPAQQLRWLIDVLQEAETKQEKVHIIGHIPNGINDCLKPWSWNYYNIVNRYESTIVAQFFGHTHKDHFELFYDQNDIRRSTSIAYISPSVTTYTRDKSISLQPGYRIYTVDDSNWKGVVDHETYVMNITEANVSDNPKWVLEYKAKEAYGLQNLFPDDWDKLVHSLSTDDNLWNKFTRYYVKSGAGYVCSGKCRTAMLCTLRTGRSHDNTFCT